MAHYRLAKWKDTIGVITDYFVGKEDLLRIFNKNNKDEKVKKYEL